MVGLGNMGIKMATKVKIPGVSASEGMRQMGPLPSGDYLLKCTKVDTKDKSGMDEVVVGTTFQVSSEVLGCEKLPPTENPRDYVGRTFVDFIFVMSPNHPKYSDVTAGGSQIGMIGVGTLKSWLNVCKVPIKNDEFDEKKAVGKWFEVRIGTRSYKDAQGQDREGNVVYEYRQHEDEQAVAESAPDEVSFEDDLITE